VLYLFPQEGTGLRLAEEQKTLETFGEEAEIGEESFYLDSLQPIEKSRFGQINPSFSAWIYFVLLGFIWSKYRSR
jgi:hypothetical protein